MSCRFPGGYTLLFIPYYSAEYTGYHWTVYDNHNKFYSFDDGDASPGEALPFTSVLLGNHTDAFRETMH